MLWTNLICELQTGHLQIEVINSFKMLVLNSTKQTLSSLSLSFVVTYNLTNEETVPNLVAEEEEELQLWSSGGFEVGISLSSFLFLFLNSFGDVWSR